MKNRKRERETKSKKRGDILSRVRPVQEVDKFTTSLFYGRSGTGKTTLASTYPKKILLLDFKDRGTDSIVDIEGVDVLYMVEWTDLEDIFWALNNDVGKYKTIILDTISGMQALSIGKVKEDKNIDESGSLSKRDWGEVSGMMTTWLMNFRDLPLHVVYLAADRIKNAPEEEEEIEGEEGRLEPEVGPAVIPSVARIINASVKIIGNTFIRQRQKVEDGKTIRLTSYVLRIGPHPYYITKIRSPKKFVIPATISNPSYDKIIKVMRGE